MLKCYIFNGRETLCWYYRHEMELILEKYGFKNITYHQKYFDDYQHMIFVGHLWDLILKYKELICLIETI